MSASNDITCLRLVRINSPLIHSYPWHTGCILNPGPLLPWIVSTAPADVEPDVLELIKTLAGEIDDLDSRMLNGNPANLYVQSILMANAPTMSESTVVSVHLAYFGKLIFSYQLLDILVWVSDWPCCPLIVDRSVIPKVTQPLARVMSQLTDWPSIIPAAHATAMCMLSSASLQQPSVVALPESERHEIIDPNADDSDAPSYLKFAGLNLQRATEHGKLRRTHDSLEQWYSTAFVISAFRPSSLQSHGHQSDLLLGLQARAEQVNFTIPYKLPEASQVKSILQYAQLASALSPLLLLVPRNGASQSINKEQLFYLARSLGTKSEPLKRTEKKLWQILLKLACGRSCSDDIRAMLRAANLQENDNSLTRNWFVAGTSAFPISYSIAHQLSSTIGVVLPDPASVSSAPPNTIQSATLSQLTSPSSSQAGHPVPQIRADQHDVGSSGQDSSTGDLSGENQNDEDEAMQGTSDGGQCGERAENIKMRSSSGTNENGKGMAGRGRNLEEEQSSRIAEADGKDDDEGESEVGEGEDDKEDDEEINVQGTDHTIQEGRNAGNVGTRSSSGRCSCGKGSRIRRSGRKGYGRKSAVKKDPTGEGTNKEGFSGRSSNGRRGSSMEDKSIKDGNTALTGLGTRQYPIYVDLDGDPQRPNTLEDVEFVPPLSEKSFEFLAYPPDPQASPITVKFQTAQSVANHEIQLLKEIQENIEAGYVEHRPPHHHASARSVSFDPSRPPQSSIFVIDYAEFAAMASDIVQNIFRHRHILLVNAPLYDLGFSITTLKNYANIHKTIDILDMSIEANGADRHQQSTVLRFFEESQKPNNGRILNVLDLPLGIEYRPSMPCQHLCSHVVAWQQMRGTPGHPRDGFPIDHLFWATAAMKNAVSWTHIDANGLGTVIDGATGTKYWVMCRRRSGSTEPGLPGDMSSMFGLASTEVDQSGVECFEHEAVIIKPGTVLIMRPNTLHYVLTIDNSITLGRHLYCTTTIRDSCWGHVHAGILLHGVTNTNHPETEILLRRILNMAIDEYTSSNIVPDATTDQSHKIDPTNAEGLLDLIALGNLVELCWIYDPRTYAGKGDKSVPSIEVAQRTAIRKAYRSFQERFSERQRLKMGGKLVDPMTALFNVSITQFAVSIYKYKELEPKTNKNFTALQMRRRLIDHFSSCRSNLVESLEEQLDTPVKDLAYCKTFNWSGPSFVVVDSEPVDYAVTMTDSHASSSTGKNRKRAGSEVDDARERNRAKR